MQSLATPPPPATVPIAGNRRKARRPKGPAGPPARLYTAAAEAWQAVCPGVGEHPHEINGWPARVLTWTAEQWQAMAHRPEGAILGANGVRAMLVMD